MNNDHSLTFTILSVFCDLKRFFAIRNLLGYPVFQGIFSFFLRNHFCYAGQNAFKNRFFGFEPLVA